MKFITLAKNKSRMIIIIFILFSSSFSQDENEFKRLGKSGFSFFKIRNTTGQSMSFSFEMRVITYSQCWKIFLTGRYSATLCWFCHKHDNRTSDNSLIFSAVVLLNLSKRSCDCLYQRNVWRVYCFIYSLSAVFLLHLNRPIGYIPLLEWSDILHIFLPLYSLLSI